MDGEGDKDGDGNGDEMEVEVEVEVEMEMKEESPKTKCSCFEKWCRRRFLVSCWTAAESVQTSSWLTRVFRPRRMR
jgi:hypothetical protein